MQRKQYENKGRLVFTTVIHGYEYVYCGDIHDTSLNAFQSKYI